MNKNSQVQIQEMLFMLIGLTLFISLVLLFFLSFSLSDIKENVAASSRQGSIVLASRLAATPEFECAEKDIAFCVDTDKVISLMNHKEYLRFWKIKGLKVEKIYPAMNRIIECSMATYPQCNIFTIIDGGTTNIIWDSSYVVLCRKEYSGGSPYPLCEFGKISVGTETSTG
ncbi:MAG: hypothetical protein AABX17_02010 [Nanoarchaeota archaeon]